MTSWHEQAGRDSVRADGARSSAPDEGRLASHDGQTGASRSRETKFTELYREHYPFVLRFALRRLRALEAAQDATVATFAVVWSRFDETPELPRPWIYRIARSVVSLELRQRMRDERVPGAPATSRLRLSAAGDEEDPVLRALSELRDDDREVLQLRAWEDLSGAEIGEVLGCSPNDAAVRLREAQQRLKELLGSPRHEPASGARAGAGTAGEPAGDAGDARSGPPSRRRSPAVVPGAQSRRDGTVTRKVTR